MSRALVNGQTHGAQHLALVADDVEPNSEVQHERMDAQTRVQVVMKESVAERVLAASTSSVLVKMVDSVTGWVLSASALEAVVSVVENLDK